MKEMDTLLNDLECDSVKATKARFLEDGDFYLESVAEALDDPGFELLGSQLETRETAAAFDTAHMLKGMIGNFGISPLYRLVIGIVEPLRTGAPDFAQLDGLYEKLISQRDKDRAIVSRYSR